MVSPKNGLEQAADLAWLRGLNRIMGVVTPIAVAGLITWLATMSTDVSRHDTAIAILELQTKAREQASGDNRAEIVALQARLAAQEIARSRADADMANMGQTLADIRASVRRVEDAIAGQKVTR